MSDQKVLGLPNWNLSSSIFWMLANNFDCDHTKIVWILHYFLKSLERDTSYLRHKRERQWIYHWLYWINRPGLYIWQISWLWATKKWILYCTPHQRKTFVTKPRCIVSSSQPVEWNTGKLDQELTDNSEVYCFIWILSMSSYYILNNRFHLDNAKIEKLGRDPARNHPILLIWNFWWNACSFEKFFYLKMWLSTTTESWFFSGKLEGSNRSRPRILWLVVSSFDLLLTIFLY